MSGKLILAATPIGNLGDLTQRLVDALDSVQEVWCEDTRVTRKILTHLGITKKLQAFHEFSPPATKNHLKKTLENGETLLYVSDAGMPGVSDPGFELVQIAHQAQAEVDILPGPSAVLTALVHSGFPNHEFSFLGFFPEKTKAQAQHIERLQNLAMTSIHFESPKRIRRTLQTLADSIPETRIAVCRELTKLHQEVIIGSPAEVQEKLKEDRGEIVLVIEPVKQVNPPDTPEAFFQRLIQEGLSPKEAVKQTSTAFGIKKREVYQRFIIQGQSE